MKAHKIKIDRLTRRKMKSILCLIGLVAIAAAYPAQEGAAYTNEAIRQAQTSHLIPQNAQIQNVSIKINDMGSQKKNKNKFQTWLLAIYNYVYLSNTELVIQILLSLINNFVE